MRARRRRRHRSIGAMAVQAVRPGAEPVNVTPLIDVVMVLIIFYLMVGHLVTQRRGDIDLPRAASGQRDDGTGLPIIVLIDAEGAVRVDGVEVRLDRAGPTVVQLRAAGGRGAVQLRADRGLPFARVRPVLWSLREAGVGSVQMAAREDGP